jgi:uncharacterized membrane protein YfcA
MLACLAATSAVAGNLLSKAGGNGLEAALGLALLVYVTLSLTPLNLAVRPGRERYWAPSVGVATGLVVGATGVLSIPSVLYLRAIGRSATTSCSPWASLSRSPRPPWSPASR